MPSREDEFWASGKEPNIRFCNKHQRYYRKDIGCQLCGFENTKSNREVEQGDIELIKCPTCWEISLMWIEQTKIYECMNFKCRHVYTEEQYIESQNPQYSEPKGKAWFGNEYFDSKMKRWRKP
ncbi:hypothetical protein ACFLVB_04740 [Chloroflexota bacterium]